MSFLESSALLRLIAWVVFSIMVSSHPDMSWRNKLIIVCAAIMFEGTP